ncbi:hypothetical protein NM688_g7744 [Phlebia brevispora]|uniref:Uncharacterized protein n=1 Tax=Phlebia brevispora TaxID=194682 RepID=A0ACC1S1L4_9APHY|nr:hypothetical protein NM688_g7744 [Phlebia brevispora]
MHPYIWRQPNILIPGIDMPLITLVSLLGVIAGCLLATRFFRRRRMNLPPGPGGLSIIYSLLHHFTMDVWLTFTEWKKTYGSLVYFNIGGQGVLVINDHHTAAELLSRRANIYSGRPRWIVANDFLCGGLFGAFIQFSDVWRSMRRAAHESVKPVAAEAFHSLQHKQAVWAVREILSSPHDWVNHLKRATTESAVRFTYGSRIAAVSVEDRFTSFLKRITLAVTPGSYLVDYFTWMKYLPSIIAPWKRSVEAHGKADTAYFLRLYKGMKGFVNNDEDASCISATVAKQQEQCKLSDLEAAWVAATLCVAGIDTSVASTMWVVRALAEFPEIQKRAQKELEAVVGHARVPTFSDRPHLPYIDAIIREALRFHPMAPLGIPHVTTKDSVYNGYFIPVGTICLPNVWGMNHDTKVYGPDADEFKPERHINANGQLKTFDACPDGHVTYGFGKRICVGRHIAQNAMFIDLAILLWALTIEPLRDAEGKPSLPPLNAISFEGLLVRPLRFTFNAKPVFPEAYGVLTGALEDMTDE